jgi:ABC-2 type transport system ATP-binding protein
MNVIELSGVSKHFGKIKALDKVSLTIKEGEILGLLGPNGAGKTTLISIMMGLLSRNDGKMTILGKNADTSWKDIKKNMNIVSGFSGVHPSMRVDEFLRYYALLYDIPKREQRMKEVMALTNISDKKTQQVRDLSAGYTQRVLFAKALLNKPKLLFLDEPTVGLDVEIGLKIKALVKRLGQEGTTIIFTSHNLHEVEEICTAITLIMNGRIKKSGTVAEFKKRSHKFMTLEITCLDVQKAAQKVKKYAKDVRIDGGTMYVDTDEKNQQAILDAVIKSGSKLHSFAIVEPTLEEAFLELVRKR